MPRRALISGAGGFLGRAVGDRLSDDGWEVWTLSRAAADPSIRRIHWDPQMGELDARSVEDFEAVVHLAGEPLIGFWTGGKKRAIMESRREGTRLLAKALARCEQKPAVMVGASAIGYYGNRGDELLRETSSRGEGFLAEVCEAWEEMTEPAARAGVRVVNFRIGLVLGGEGGMMKTVLPLFRFGLGGKLGGGRQWWSWVSVDDVAAATLFAIGDRSLSGPVNVVAPNPVTNAEFTKALGSKMGRPTVFTVPRLALKATMREVADEMLLSSQRVACDRLEQAGYRFLHSTVDEALDAVLRR